MLIEMVSPEGKIIAVPHWVRNDLRRFKLLQWNRDVRLWEISKEYKEISRLLELGGGRQAPLRASDPGRLRTSPKKSGRVDPLVKFLGPDGNGPSHCRVLRVRRQALRR